MLWPPAKLRNAAALGAPRRRTSRTRDIRVISLTPDDVLEFRVASAFSQTQARKEAPHHEAVSSRRAGSTEGAMSIARKLAIPAAIAIAAVCSAPVAATAATTSHGASAFSTAQWPTPPPPLKADGQPGASLLRINTTPWQCTFGSTDGNVQTCFQIVGSGGTNVTSMSVTSCIKSAAYGGSARTLYQTIVDPYGNLMFKDGEQSVAAGSCYPGYPTDTWFPRHGTVPVAGQYCGITWRVNTDNTATNIGEVCAGVDS
jgi:hypothetical protein